MLKRYKYLWIFDECGEGQQPRCSAAGLLTYADIGGKLDGAVGCSVQLFAVES